MSLKGYKQFIAEVAGNRADDLTPNKSVDDSKSIKVRAKGEQDFVDMHKMTHTKHPVAGDHQFNGDRSAISEELYAELNEASSGVVDILRTMKGGEVSVKFKNGQSELIDKGTAQEVLKGLKKLKGSKQKEYATLLGKSPDTFFRMLDTILK